MWIIVYYFWGSVAYSAGAFGFWNDIFRTIGGNLVFFGLFGLATLVPSFSRPRDEPIDRRLDFLITSKHITNSAKDFIRGEVKRLGAYFESSDFNLIIHEVDFENNSMRVERRSNIVVRNTFEGEEYEDSAFRVLAHPDNVSKPVDRFGEIAIAEIITSSGPVDLLQTPHHLKSPDLFECVAKILIPRNSSVFYRIHLWIWCVTDIPYFLYFHRFADSAAVRLRNSSGQMIRVAIDCKDGQVADLADGGEIVLYQGQYSPGYLKLFHLLPPSP
jgi:hypothetical protein